LTVEAEEVRDPRQVSARRVCGLTLAAAFLASALLALFGCEQGRDVHSRPNSRYNVLVFLLDAARADHLGCYGYGRDTTPNIDEFAKTATRYASATSEAAFTFASIAALFTGKPPGRSGLIRARRVDLSFSLLADAARASGYRTYAYSENPFVSKAFGFSRGFEHFEEMFPYEVYLRSVEQFPSFDALAGIERALRFMGSDRGSPFFVYLHLLRPHNPYEPPAGFAGRFGSKPASATDGSTETLLAIDAGRREISPEEMENIIALYDENLFYGDWLFGELHRGVRELGLLADTVIVVLSDHGEAFREHGRMLHSSTVYEEMIRIPLLIHVPELAGGVSTGPVQLADLGMALRAVMTEEDAEPQHLAALTHGAEPTVSWTISRVAQAGVRTPRRKLIVDTRRLLPLGFYDLIADPTEHRSIALDEVGDRLFAAIRAEVLRTKQVGAVSVDRERDRKTAQRLRSLGYIEE
jgi:arylsulfatase